MRVPLFKRHKTIRHVADEGGFVQFHNYFHGRCIWVVRAYAKFHDACKGCAMSRRYYCGYYCRQNLFIEVLPETKRLHCKRVNEGDVLIGESGQRYIVKRDGYSLFAEKENEKEVNV